MVRVNNNEITNTTYGANNLEPIEVSVNECYSVPSNVENIQANSTAPGNVSDLGGIESHVATSDEEDGYCTVRASAGNKAI